MRALIRTGESKALSLDPSHPEPTAAGSPSCYIIRAKAAALTREELTWPELLIPKIPIPGFDLAGVVISAPTAPHPQNKSYKFKTGDEIYALTTIGGNGNAREITEAHEKEMALKPKNMSWEEAATVPLSALSAWQALFVHGKLTPNFSDASSNARKKVLITAGSGGVGVWAVQFARLIGAKVVSTCGPSNVDFLKDLGADIVLDYTKKDLLEWVNEDREARAFDVILDCKGGQVLEASWRCARAGGIVISVAEPPDPKKPAEGTAEGVEGVWFIVSENAEQLSQIMNLIEAGKCHGVVDSVFSLEQWKEAFERLEGGHARGKVVLKVN